MCGNIACVVNTLDDEKDVPVIWRAEELSKLEGPKAAHPGKQLQKERGTKRPLQGTLGEDVGESCVVEYDDECDERDYCVPEDERASAKGDYVSLVDNPERFTGYSGSGANMVWDAIYSENCFTGPSVPSSRQFTTKATGGKAGSFGAVAPQPPTRQAANDLRSVLQANSPSLAFPLEEECLEKRVFYRVISGMHASISTHICHDYLNQSTGTWGPNLQCYTDRLGSHPDRISNLYFNYALVLRAVAKLRTYLTHYTFCTGDVRQDQDTRSKVLALADAASSAPTIFDESLMFADPEASGDLKEDFRSRFRNVSRLMDCVGCDKCRLWGKLQTVGYGTALKVLFEYDEEKDGENPPLRRTELVALVNTLARISHSLTALENFRKLTGTNLDGTPIAKVPGSEQTGKNKRQKAPVINENQHASDEAAAEAAAAHDRHNDNDDDDGLDDFEDLNHKLNDTKESTWEEITSEIHLVYRAFVYILKSWISLPGLAWNIALMEMERIWNFWLGLPVGERAWEFKVPSREDL